MSDTRQAGSGRATNYLFRILGGRHGQQHARYGNWFSTPGTPEAAICFVRGNVLVCVENAGEKPAAELRELTRKIDQSLKSVAR